jgi:hypothetical protein
MSTLENIPSAKSSSNFFRRHLGRLLFLVLMLGIYLLTWTFRRELGFAHPMANMMYYHYGEEPNSFTDRAAYWIYYPLYVFGDRYGIHWSDRADPYDVSAFQ